MKIIKLHHHRIYFILYLQPRKSTSNLSNHSVSSWVDIDSNGFVGSNTDSSNRQGRGTLVSSGSKRSGSTITPITVESSETSNVKVPKLTSTQPPGAVDNNGLLAPTENKRVSSTDSFKNTFFMIHTMTITFRGCCAVTCFSCNFRWIRSFVTHSVTERHLQPCT